MLETFICARCGNRRPFVERTIFAGQELCRSCCDSETCESASFSVSGMGWGWQADYIRKLRQAAVFCGYDGSLVDRLLYEGYSTDDIEDFIYCREGVWE